MERLRIVALLDCTRAAIPTARLSCIRRRYDAASRRSLIRINALATPVGIAANRRVRATSPSLAAMRQSAAAPMSRFRPATLRPGRS
jgi:hypothetical protein